MEPPTLLQEILSDIGLAGLMLIGLVVLAATCQHASNWWHDRVGSVRRGDRR